MPRFSLARLCAVLCVLLSSLASADAPVDRFGAAGYFRIMTRPDFSGGSGRLGYWWLYGRLLNEGPYGELNLRMNVLQTPPGSKDVWAIVHTRIAGTSFQAADADNGLFGNFKATQLYVQVGNVLLDNVTWQIGTLENYWGDLHIYDLRPSNILYDTVGLSGTYQTEKFDVMLAVGDSGYFIKKSNYDTIFTGGASLRYRFLPGKLEAGVRAQVGYEPPVAGNRNALYRTSEAFTYEDFARKEIIRRAFETDPNYQPRSDPFQPRGGTSFRTVGYLGFGNVGPVVWNNFYASWGRQHPDAFYKESYGGEEYLVPIADLTDERYELFLGNEMNLTLVPGKLDVLWGAAFGYQYNKDNSVKAGEDNRTYYGTVVRLHYYFTDTFQLLGETSLARETAHNGNLFREHSDSIFSSTAGLPDTRGLEFGDSNTRNTWQGKVGVALTPKGKGVFSRPSLRVLYGLQYSSQQAAFGNSFVDTLDQYNLFTGPERHWHQVVSIEAEKWF
ncbi:carbohydrate porin [Myxococcaceae bacterium GXIMD 01537]